MRIGVVGLGKMGGPIAEKFKKMECLLRVYDADSLVRQEFASAGFDVSDSIENMSSNMDVIWLMVPAPVVDSVLDHLCACIQPDTVIIDGGNSFYEDGIRRSKRLEAQGLSFLDCGTSGGLWGADHGFSMTIGGSFEIFKKVEQVFKILAAAPTSYLYTGPSGSGHYVKMIHNGIEYALLEAYAEGFQLLHEGHYKNLDLAAISHVWLKGAIIRSFILELAHSVLERDQQLASVLGAVGETGTGRWTIEEAAKYGIKLPVIEEAVAVRTQSREIGGTYATKLVALLRHEMGGHAVTPESCAICQSDISS